MVDEKITEISVDNPLYKKFAKAWKYAWDMTVKETCQATEGLFHNLN